MKTRQTFTVDAELIGRTKGLVAGSKGRLSLAGLAAMVLAQIVGRLERSGAPRPIAADGFAYAPDGRKSET